MRADNIFDNVSKTRSSCSKENNLDVYNQRKPNKTKASENDLNDTNKYVRKPRSSHSKENNVDVDYWRKENITNKNDQVENTNPVEQINPHITTKKTKQMFFLK